MVDIMSKIKAVIFDWGGVLIDNPAEGLVKYCSDHIGVTTDEFNKIFLDYYIDFQRGILPESKMWAGICARLGVGLPDSDSLWGDAVRATFVEKDETFNLIKDLKRKGLKIGFLSNTEMPSMLYFEEMKYADRCGFDAIVFSCAEKCVKPEEKIYSIAINRLGIQANEAIFIDDRNDFLIGAERIGIKGLLYNNPEQVKKDLDNLLNK